MLNFILFVLLSMSIIALLNWKLPRKRARQWSIIPIVAFLVYSLLIQAEIITFEMPEGLIDAGVGLTLAVMLAPMILIIQRYISPYQRSLEGRLSVLGC